MAVFCTSSITAQTTLWRFAFIRTEGIVHTAAARFIPFQSPTGLPQTGRHRYHPFRALHRP